MRRTSRVFALAVVLPALLLSAVAVSASPAPLHDHLYLLGSDSDYLYWSADPADPDLGVSTITRTCGLNYATPGDAKPCTVGLNAGDGTRTYNVSFYPSTLLDEKVTWGVATPLRFHIEGTVNTLGAPYTVQLVFQKSSGQVISDPATQTGPGVWEGKLPTGGGFNVGEINVMVIRVTTSAPVATIELRAGGRSYLELPRPFAMHSVPELVHEDTYAPEPNSYQTATRTFNFNDRSWAARSFTGETGPARQFSFNLDQKAEILFAWIEVYDSAFVQDVRRGRAPDPQKILQGASVRLLRDGTEIDHSGSGFGTLGQGTEALAVLDLTPGPLTLSVDSQNESEDDSIPFTVHVVEVRGERTLRSMRWLFMEMDGVRTPVVAVCPRSIEPVPTTDKVRSVALDLDWNSEAAGLRGWTFSYSLPGVGSFPCSEAGTGDEMRLTIPPAERVWYLGATPAYNATEVSAFDTTFEMSARYTYSPVPLA